MSRVAKSPVDLPKGVTVTVSGQEVSAKGPVGTLSVVLHSSIQVSQEEGQLTVSPIKESKDGFMMAGTMRSLLNNLVVGVSTGWEKKLALVGVGYRAKAEGTKVNLTLGFSHPVVFNVPKGVTVETPSQTEIIVKGADKQAVGQVAAELRAYRSPEPYKGKGVRYVGEHISLKEAKKK